MEHTPRISERHTNIPSNVYYVFLTDKKKNLLCLILCTYHKLKNLITLLVIILTNLDIIL